MGIESVLDLTPRFHCCGFQGMQVFPKVPKKLPRASLERKTDACLLIFFLPKLAQGIQHRGHSAHPLSLQQVLGFTYFSLQQW